MPVTMASTSSGGTEIARLRQERGTLRVDDRILIRFGDRVGHGFLGRRRFRRGPGRGVPQRVGHQADGAVLGPGGLVGSG
ncbi:MAG: hypothetical protein WB509_12890, partial [Acetobacteraceae bacterium]